jgi:hypothetical protein
MAKKHSGRAEEGIQFHLQNLVNDEPEKLNNAIYHAFPYLKSWTLTPPVWVSPLAQNDYKEYQGREFLEKVNCSEACPLLKQFWPMGGPVWDGLATLSGKRGERGVILLEANSHTKEVIDPSYACKASGKSLEKISTSLNMVKCVLGVEEKADWLGEVYQHANRIAHLYFLRIVAHIPTWLVLLYFIGDKQQEGPEHAFHYDGVLREVKAKLALPDKHILSDYMGNVFIEVPYIRKPSRVGP